MTPLPKKKLPCPTCAGSGSVVGVDGATLAKERKRRGLTQTAIARESGWFPSVVSEIESGARPMTPASAERYWNALLAAERKRGKS